MNTRKGVKNKWFILILLSAAVGLIYQLPYLRYSYYDAMLEAFGYSNAQLGNLMSAYGIGSVICYIIGGAVANWTCGLLVCRFSGLSHCLWH